MDELVTLARPYAKASFKYANETKTLPQWSAVLAILAAASKEPAVVDLLYSPTMTVQQKAAGLIYLCGDRIDDAMGRFLTLLAENRRLSLLPQIQQLFEDFKSQQEKLLDVEVRTAFVMNDKTKKSLVEKLSANFDSRINITVNVDKALIGGIVIGVGDTIIDGSVRGRLAQLAEAIN